MTTPSIESAPNIDRSPSHKHPSEQVNKVVPLKGDDRYEKQNIEANHDRCYSRPLPQIPNQDQGQPNMHTREANVIVGYIYRANFRNEIVLPEQLGLDQYGFLRPISRKLVRIIRRVLRTNCERPNRRY